MKSYGSILRELRQRAGYAIVDAARTLRQHGYEVTNTNISRWENGYNNPSLEQFLGLCALYGVDDVYAVFFKQDLAGVGSHLNKDGLERLEAYRDLLVSSGWFAQEDEQDDPVNRGLRNALPLNMTNDSALRADPQHWGIVPGRAGDGWRQDRTSEPGDAEAGAPFPAGAALAPGYAEVQRTLYRSHTERRVPLYSMRAGEVIPFSAPTTSSVALPSAVPSRTNAAVEVESSNMEPLLQPGSIAYVSTEEDVQNGDVVVVAFNGRAYIKQLRETEDGARWLISANAAYLPVRVGEEDSLTVLGKITYPAAEPEAIEFEAEWEDASAAKPELMTEEKSSEQTQTAQ